MESENSEEKAELEIIITQSYEGILSASRDDALWSVRYWELYRLIYKYLETYVFPKTSNQYLDFIEAFSDDYKDGKENKEDKSEKPHSTFLNFLLKENIPKEKFVSKVVSIIYRAIKQTKEKTNWFFKSGGCKISEKTLRKIASGISDAQFDLISENYEYDGESLSLFEDEEAAEKNPFNDVPLRLRNVEETEDLKKLLDEIDEKYVKEVSYKTKNIPEKLDENKIKKPYLCAIVTRVILLMFMGRKWVPIDTMNVLLLHRHFLYRPLYDYYIKNSEVYEQKKIAEIFNTTEKIISSEQGKFFRSFSKEKINLLLRLAGGNK